MKLFSLMVPKCKIQYVLILWNTCLTVTIRESLSPTIRAGSLQPRGWILRKWHVIGLIWWPEVIPRIIKPSIRHKNYHFLFTFPVERIFQVQLPVWSDSTKSCGIQFQGGPLKNFFGYNLVQDPKYAHLWVIGCREPPRMDHTVWWQLKEILNRFQVTWRFFYSREKWICNVLNSTGENFKYLKGEKIVMVYKIVVEDKIVMDDKIVMVYHLHYSGVMVGSNKKFDDSSNWISSDRFHEISIKNLLSEKKEFESQKHRKNLTELACKTSILFDTVLFD